MSRIWRFARTVIEAGLPPISVPGAKEQSNHKQQPVGFKAALEPSVSAKRKPKKTSS